MDAEAAEDPLVIPPTTKVAAETFTKTGAGTSPTPTTGATPLSDPLRETALPTAAETRLEAMTAFRAAPRLRDPTNTPVEDISTLLHLLLDTPESLVTLARITPCIAGTEAVRIRKTWSSHLEHEGTLAPLGSVAQDFFMNVLLNSPLNVGEQAEVANLLRHYITETIKESTLRPHTTGAPLDEPMPQSSSKRGREEAGNTEDTAIYPGYTQSSAPATVVPLPRPDPPVTVVTEAPTPLQLREKARTAFLALPMLPELDQLEMDHVSALLALLVDGEWGSTVVSLLAKQWPKKKTTTIWKAWEPYLSHPPAHPTGKQR